MRVLLAKEVEKAEKVYSIEAGLHDGVRHFDHHGEFSQNASPCNNPEIPVIAAGSVVYISHIDADTYIALLRMQCKELPEIDLSLLEKIDCNGSSIIENKFDPTLLYSVGVGQLARKLNFPRVSNETQDVTDIVYEMFSYSEEEIIQLGRVATEKSEATYENCLVSKLGNIGYWVIGADDPLNPSRPYEDDFEVVVVHRRHYKSISIYCAPSNDYAFAGQEIAGIQFAGHPKACGSPRGTEFDQKDGQRVFEELAQKIN